MRGISWAHLHDLGIYGRIILKWILEIWNESEVAGPVEPLRNTKYVTTSDKLRKN